MSEKDAFSTLKLPFRSQ